MVVRRRGRKEEISGWSWRLFGLVVCAFFGLGVAAGLGAHAKVAFSLSSEINSLYYRFARAAGLMPPRAFHQVRHDSAFDSAPTGVALVERRDGFYLLLSDGSLHGPTAPGFESDYPVISGGSIEESPQADLLDYAGKLVRAEAALSVLASEMRILAGGTFSIFLERSRTELVFTHDDFN